MEADARAMIPGDSNLISEQSDSRQAQNDDSLCDDELENENDSISSG